MKSKIILSFILILSISNLFAKNKPNIGTSLSTGFTTTNPLLEMNLNYKAQIQNFYPIDLGGYLEYEILNRLNIQTGLNFGFDNYQLLYRDVIKTDSLILEAPNDAINIINNPLMIKDNIHLFNINVPVYLKYRLLGDFFCSWRY